MRPPIAGLAALVMLASIAQAKAAIVCDAADDFSIASNPNDVWSYGFRNTATSVSFSPYTSTDSTFLGITNVHAWLDVSDSIPSISKNIGASPITVYDTTWQPDQLVIHPGKSGSNDEYVVLRWTAPRGGLFSIDVTFTGTVWMSGTTTNVHVIGPSGTSLFDADISGGPASPANTHSFSSTLALAKNDTLDFVAGPSGNYYSDSTAVDLAIRSIPEPSTFAIWSIIGVCFIGIGWYRRRKAP